MSFGGRNSYARPWLMQRIYPANFEGQPPQQQQQQHGDEDEYPPSQAPPAADVEAPPPTYKPSGRRGSVVQTRASVYTAPTCATAKVSWSYHPTAFGAVDADAKGPAWMRYLRLVHYYRCLLRSDHEVLSDAWPASFSRSLFPRTATTGSLSLARTRSTVSSATTTTTAAGAQQQHPLAPLFTRRVATLNSIIGPQLAKTRTLLALCELINLTWLIVLIVAIAVCQGQQRPFLQGVEIALVLIFLINGASVNYVRIQRWSLSKTLRLLSRDWSPLPVSTTNRGLLNIGEGYTGERATGFEESGTDGGGRGAPSTAAQQSGENEEEKATLRWSMRRHEVSDLLSFLFTLRFSPTTERRCRSRRSQGSWWMSYRPIIHVELVTPPQRRARQSPHAAVSQPVVVVVESAEGTEAAPVAQTVPAERPPEYAA